jgi:excisionase family DNA binding protein
MGKRTYTTSEVAEKLQVSRETLYQWMRSKQIPEPEQIKLGKKTQYLWTDEDITAAEQRKFLRAVTSFAEGFPKFHRGKPIKRTPRRKS